VPLSLKQIAAALNGEIRGGEVRAPGPGHSHKDRSLSVRLKEGGDDIIVHSFSPADNDLDCLKWAREKCGIEFKPNGNRRAGVDLANLIQTAVASQSKAKPAYVFDYKDRDGTVLYQIRKYAPTGLSAHRPNGKGGWIDNLDGFERRVLYRLPELITFSDATVFFTEGEKDADRVASLDLCSTTIAFGKWTDECADALAGRHVWILEDNDEAGRVRALEAAQRLHPVAASVRIIRLPGLPSKGDVSDWLNVGHTKDELIEVCCAAPDWTLNSTAETQPTKTQPTETVTGSLKSGEPIPGTPPKLAPLCFIKIEDWLDREPPSRDWGVPDRFPLRNVSLLSGEGSIGKSIVLMQLAAAHVLSRGWLDTLPEFGDALYLNAEDEQDELHRRFVDIAKLYDASLAELKDHLHLLAMAGQDAVLGHANNSGLVKPTPLFHKLVEAAGDIKPKFIGLDTSADVFAGNESDRSQVRQFIGLLRHMAIIGNSAVIVCAHPSLTGISTGTGLSGSTAWHNSVRARAYLHSVTVDNTEPDKTLRQLDFMKSNYSAIADSITLRWKDGVFVPEAKPGSLERIAADAKADETFMALLNQFNEQGRNVSHVPGPTYAPTVFAKAAKGSNRAQMADAMNRLFNANKIKVENYGRPSRPYRRIVACLT
jgi:RecA-family ATPase